MRGGGKNRGHRNWESNVEEEIKKGRMCVAFKFYSCPKQEVWELEINRLMKILIGSW